MKILLILIFLTTVACDNPQRTRFKDIYTNIQAPVDPNQQAIDGGDLDEQEENENPITTPGFDQCSLNMDYYGGTHIGYLGLCQSTLNESTFKVKMAEADATVGTCFVPIHIAGQNSFKLGIAECVHNQANKIYDMVLTKERAEPINGVMVIKAGSAVNGYMQCMNAKIDYIQNLPGTNFHIECLNTANGHPDPYARPDAYASCVCTQFVGAFSTFYKQISL